MASEITARTRREAGAAYVLDAQIGFILRQVAQRHSAIFATGVAGDVTPTQWAALSKLAELGPLSQNHLGRLTVMDAATIKGVIDRLSRRGLVEIRADPNDGRRRVVTLSEAGRVFVQRLAPKALQITEDTLAPLDGREREALKALLLKLR